MITVPAAGKTLTTTAVLTFVHVINVMVRTESSTQDDNCSRIQSSSFLYSMLLGASIRLVSKLRLWLKIQKMGDILLEMPPPSVTAW
jgi:hypothetical protein